MRPYPRQHLLTAVLVPVLGTFFAGGPACVAAQTNAQENRGAVELRLPAQPLAAALQDLSRQSGLQIVAATELLAGLNSRPVSGRMAPSDALRGLLAGTGLVAEPLPNGGYALRRATAADAAPEAASHQLPAVQISARSGAGPTDLTKTYAGGQVARGGRMGLLGNVDLMDTPFNVTAFTAELMQNQQARTIVDVLANDPSSHAAGPWHFDNFYIRGFRVLRDEIGFDGLYGLASSEGILLDGIERLEVLKGPSTLLNGASTSGTTGGAINLVPKRAGAEPLTRLTTAFISDGNLGAQLDVGRRFGQDQAFGARVNVAYRDGDGQRDRESLNIGNLTAGLDFRGERLRVSADLGSSRQKVDGSNGNFFVANSVTAMPAPPKGKSNLWQTWEYQDKEHSFGMLRADYDLSDNWTAGAAYGRARSLRSQISSFHTIQNAAGDTTAATSGFAASTVTDSGEASLRGRFSTGALDHQLALSASRVESEYSQFRLATLGSYTSNLSNPTIVPDAPAGTDLSSRRSLQSDTTLRSYALADTVSAFDNRLRLTLGVRRQQIRVEGFAVTGARTAFYDQSATTPAVAVVYKPEQGVSVYANYVEALSAGGSAPSTAVNAGEVFAPFVSKQREVGVKVDWGTATGTLSVFQINQPSGLLDAGNRYSIDGEQRNRGVELQSFGEPVRGLRMLGGVTWTQGILLKTQGGLTDGRQAAGAPKWQAKIGGEWDLPFVPGLTATARVNYTSAQPINVENTLRIPSWTRLDLGARYAMRVAGKPVTLRATIENVTDRDYWDAVVAFRAPTYASPRTYLVSATVDF
ncbi:TonB-dependent siderophore receptor [Roseateles sp.]|uniref:TonB-dependent siderophore receptor n=1 Tax=Roseateles sp. TaxID=1971397 RepID=UPI0039E75E93